VIVETVTHRLAFAVRIEDHFSREPVAEELEVRLDTGEPPVAARTGGHRHADGTYRWADLVDGLRTLSIRSASGRWTRMDPTPIDVALPLTAAEAQTAVRIEMWPTPAADPPPGVPAIRGVLAGAAVAGLRVEIDGTAAPDPTGRFTVADAGGELLFPLPGGPWPRTADGRLDLTVVVPGRTVVAVDVVSDSPITSFAGPQFHIAPDRASRVRFHVT
jgi:hypothetical protein